MSRGQTTLFCSAQQQGRGQRAQTETEEVLLECEDSHLFCEGGRMLEKAPGSFGSPLKIFQTCPGYDPMQSLLGDPVLLDDLQRFLLTPNVQ